MFARLIIVQIDIDKLEEVRRIVEESTIPAVKLQKGFRGGYLLADHKTGKGISMTLWDSEEDATADEQSGHYQKRAEKVKHLFTSQPVREGYEVVVQY
jgi:heme-degrading monooxygenase HmoA